jgi:hypothetical protein
MPPAAPAFVGIDVAKAELVIAIRPSGDRRTVANDEAGIQTLLEELVPDEPPTAALQDRRTPAPSCPILHPGVG